MWEEGQKNSTSHKYKIERKNCQKNCIQKDQKLYLKRKKLCQVEASLD